MTAVVTLIGDVVGSRGASDRAGLHGALTAAMATINDSLSPVTPLRITVGDEYQGCFAALGPALHATLRLRLALAPGVDVRHGLGRGEVEVLSERPRVEDGPGWWAARAAIEGVEAAQRQPGARRLRTAYVGEGEAAVNAALVARDELLGGLDERALSVLSGMLSGMSQQEIADKLEVSPSAVSQRVRGGLAALATVDRLLGEIT